MGIRPGDISKTTHHPPHPVLSIPDPARVFGIRHRFWNGFVRGKSSTKKLWIFCICVEIVYIIYIYICIEYCKLLLCICISVNKHTYYIACIYIYTYDQHWPTWSTWRSKRGALFAMSAAPGRRIDSCWLVVEPTTKARVIDQYMHL